MNNDEKQAVLSKFPSFKLCYETISHNKVDASALKIAIPKGPKCFLWFSLHHGNPVCFLIERGRQRGTITNIEPIVSSFDPIIIGTILSGTLVNIKHKQFIVIDDIYSYKRNHHNKPSFDVLCSLFKDNKIRNVLEFKNQIMLAPVGDQELTAYTPFYCIQYRVGTKYTNILLNNKSHSINSSALVTFKVVAEDQNDIYTLITNDGVECGLACIPSYEISKMMNSIFRNIKENRCLDLLEESDDEDEFENVSADKFVLDKNKVVKMDCIYVSKFGKWQPIKQNEGGSVVHSRQLDRTSNYKLLP